MSFGRLGKRLPPLQAIGRTQRIDLDDDPPDLDNDDLVEGFEAQRTVYTPPYYYEAGHADAAAVALSGIFKTLDPGGHVCKRAAGQPSTSFTHCQASVKFASRFSELRQLLEERARLQLVRDYITRLNALAMFVKDLQRVVLEEMSIWRDICQRLLETPPTSHLLSLSAILEDLRLHMNHWNSLKQILHTDRWLRRNRPKLTLQLEKIHEALSQLRNQALWWTDRLIHVGLRVLAHCDLERLSQDSLWSITRGLEDFNTLVMAVKLDSSIPQLGANLDSYNVPSPFFTNHTKNMVESLKPIPFARVLNMLANERAQYAAATSMDFFVGNPDYLRLVSLRPIPEYSWIESGLRTMRNSTSTQTTVDTSDYHSATGSHVSLSTAMLRVGGLVAPDLSKEPSPLFDFSRREQTFANRFLQIVCHSTNLLKKPGNLPSRGSSVKSRITSNHDTENHPPNTKNKVSIGGMRESSGPGLPIPSKHRDRVIKVEAKSSDTLAEPDLDLSRSDPKRKSVSWGDAAEVSIIQQLSVRYMELMWQYLGTHLTQFLVEPAWRVASPSEQKRLHPSLVTERLGSIDLCPVTARMMVVCMIQQTCVKDIFPVGAVPALLSVACKIQASAAWTAWDSAYSKALASQVTDKCGPTPLADGESCTQTALLIRNSYHPLVATLQALDLPQPDAKAKESAQWQAGRNVTCALLLPTLQKLTVTFDLASKWCQVKATQFLASKSVGQFLLVTQADLKVVLDESRRALELCQHACKPPDTQKKASSSTTPSSSSPVLWAGHLVQGQLSVAWQKLNDITACMQMLCGSCMKQFQTQCTAEAQDFFQDEMRPGKEWRRKALQELPKEASPYVEQAVLSLLGPVIQGVSGLKTTAQLGVVSVAVTAVCDAWLQHILNCRIRFSFCGACQLEQDFLFMRTWLERHIQEEDVRHSILALDAFKHMSAVVGLLKKQPRARSQGPPQRRNDISRPISTSDSEQNMHGSITESCEVSVSSSSVDPYTASSDITAVNHGNGTSSPDSHYYAIEKAGSVANGYSSSMDGEDEGWRNYKVPKMEQWLALRVHGGARNWPRFPSCFNNPNS